MALYVVEPWKRGDGSVVRASHQKEYWMEGSKTCSTAYDNFSLHSTLKVYEKPSVTDLEAIHASEEPSILLQMGKPVGHSLWSRKKRTTAHPGGLLAHERSGGIR